MIVILIVAAPVGYVGANPSIGRVFTPGVLALLIWQLRIVWTAIQRKETVKIKGTIALWLSLTGLAVTSILSIAPTTTIKWGIVFLVCVLMPVIAGQYNIEYPTELLLRALAVAAILLASTAIVELTSSYNLWNSVYTSDVQALQWSVFRAKASLGHPLSLMAVSSTAFVTLAIYAINKPGTLNIIGAISALIATLLAVSRTSALAIAVGVAVAGSAFLLANRSRLTAKYFLLVPAAVGSIYVLLGSSLLVARDSGQEGRGSELYRQRVAGYARAMIEENFVHGLGPGTANNEFYLRHGFILENSAFQFAISGGMILAVPTLVLAVFLAKNAVRNNRVHFLAGLATFCTAITGFNALESNPALLSLAGLFIASVMTPHDSSSRSRSMENGEPHAANLHLVGGER